jgi:hypothetical protein
MTIQGLGYEASFMLRLSQVSKEASPWKPLPSSVPPSPINVQMPSHRQPLCPPWSTPPSGHRLMMIWSSSFQIGSSEVEQSSEAWIML